MNGKLFLHEIFSENVKIVQQPIPRKILIKIEKRKSKKIGYWLSIFGLKSLKSNFYMEIIFFLNY